MTVSDELDADTIHQALWGQPPASGRAFGRFYEHYEPLVRYVVGGLARRRGYLHHVDELRQEVWVRLLERDRKLLRYYDPARGPLSRFLSLLAYQAAARVVEAERRQVVGNKRQRSLPFEGLPDPGLDFDAELVQSDVYRKLMQRASAELDEVDRVVLREVYLAQRRGLDVAVEHGLKPELVYKRKQRLEEKLTLWCDELLAAAPARRPSSAPTALLLVAILAGLATDLAVEPVLPSCSPCSPPERDTPERTNRWTPRA